MSHFEYAAIFYGIVTALAVENVASSFHKLFDAGSRVRWHWMAPTNALGSTIGALGQFWLWWIARDLPGANPTFLTFLPGALTSLLLYLVCAAALPDEVPAAGIDLRAFYFSSHRQFWALVVATLLLRIAVNVWGVVRSDFDPQILHFNTVFGIEMLVAAGIAASMICVRASWWHGAGIIVITAGVFLMFGPMKL